MTLSIIIVSYNTRQVTYECLQSVFSATWREPFEVIVVDNNSTDGSIEMIRDKYPQVTLVTNDYNALFARANNQGAAVAKGKYLLLLNSDTLVWDDNLQRMTEHFDTLPSDVICIGPRVLNPDGSLQGTCAPVPGRLERFAMCAKLNRILPPSLISLIIKGLPGDYPHECGWVPGCSMMVRKDLYLKVGGLNEKVEFYGEEPEFGYRTSKLGYKTIYWNGAEIIHLGGVSTKTQADSHKQEPTKEEIRKSEETRLRRYSLLQRETVGYRKAIQMSQIVLCFAYLKRLLASNKPYFTRAIIWEKKVLSYLRQKQKEKI